MQELAFIFFNVNTKAFTTNCISRLSASLETTGSLDMRGFIFSTVFLCGLLYTPVLPQGQDLGDLCKVMRCGSGTQCRIAIPVGSSEPTAACIPDDQLPSEENPICYKDKVVFDETENQVYSPRVCPSASCPSGSVCPKSKDGGLGVCCSHLPTPGFCPPQDDNEVCGGEVIGCVSDPGCPTEMKCCASSCGGSMCKIRIYNDCDACTEDQDCVKKDEVCESGSCFPIYECVPKPADHCGGCPRNEDCIEKSKECEGGMCIGVYECVPRSIEDSCGGCAQDEICVYDSPWFCSSPDCGSYECKPDKCEGRCTGDSICSLAKANTCKECTRQCEDEEKCAFIAGFCFGFRDRIMCISAFPGCVDANVKFSCPRECREDERCILYSENCPWPYRGCQDQLMPTCVKTLLF